jgi:hypothetical protein
MEAQGGKHLSFKVPGGRPESSHLSSASLVWGSCGGDALAVPLRRPRSWLASSGVILPLQPLLAKAGGSACSHSLGRGLLSYVDNGQWAVKPSLCSVIPTPSPMPAILASCAHGFPGFSG